MSSELIDKDGSEVAVYDGPEERAFALLQRRAKVYSTSTMVPKEYQGNIGNCIIAMNMASRIGADVLAVMQNLYVVHGSPGWSSKFLVATFNQCGRFSPIQYKFTGERGKLSWGCIAYAEDLATGTVLHGTEVTMQIAKDEGWIDKSGSKWKTMPEQMLRYRSAAFFVRTAAPEVAMGILTVEELHDIAPPTPRLQGELVKLNEILDDETVPKDAKPSKDVYPDADPPEGVSGEFADGLFQLLQQCKSNQDIEDVRKSWKDQADTIEQVTYVDDTCDSHLS